MAVHTIRVSILGKGIPDHYVSPVVQGGDLRSALLVCRVGVDLKFRANLLSVGGIALTEYIVICSVQVPRLPDDDEPAIIEVDHLRAVLVGKYGSADVKVVPCRISREIEPAGVYAVSVAIRGEGLPGDDKTPVLQASDRRTFLIRLDIGVHQHLIAHGLSRFIKDLRVNAVIASVL